MALWGIVGRWYVRLICNDSNSVLSLQSFLQSICCTSCHTCIVLKSTLVVVVRPYNVRKVTVK